MVRERRRRYIVVNVEGELDREKLISFLKGFGGGGELWLIHYDGKRALIRTDHRTKERAVEYLNRELEVDEEGRKVTLRTIGVTGTIKKARMKYLGGIPLPRAPRRRTPSDDRRRRGRRMR